jgi:hypothetical protein
MEECKTVWSWYQIAKDFIPSFATLLVALFSIRFAVLQIKKQHQNALDLQSENRKKDIQIALFEEIQERLDSCGSLAYKLSTSLIYKITYLENGVDISHNELEFIQELDEVSRAITTVTIYIEYREIVSPKLFRVFRSALHSAHHELMAVIQNRDGELVQRLRQTSKAAGDAASYCHDLNACLQNHAFGDLFKNSAPVREPIDPDEKVIVDDDDELDMLLHYFEHETSYGRQMDETKRQVRDQFGQSNDRAR